MVVISVAAISRMATTQDRIASPFLWTVQAPHSAIPQPNLVAVRLSSSRRYHNNGISGSPSNERSTPLTLNWIIVSFPFKRVRPWFHLEPFLLVRIQARKILG